MRNNILIAPPKSINNLLSKPLKNVKQSLNTVWTDAKHQINASTWKNSRKIFYLLELIELICPTLQKPLSLPKNTIYDYKSQFQPRKNSGILLFYSPWKNKIISSLGPNVSTYNSYYYLNKAMHQIWKNFFWINFDKFMLPTLHYTNLIPYDNCTKLGPFSQTGGNLRAVFVLSPKLFLSYINSNILRLKTILTHLPCITIF